jgi:hypothetical protein
MDAIKDFQCDPNHQHQHFAERMNQKAQKIKKLLLGCTRPLLS